MKKKNKDLWKGIQRSFLALRYVFFTGLIMILPLAFTIYALQLVFSFIDRWPRDMLSNILIFICNILGFKVTKEQINVPGMGLLMSVFLICIVGIISSKVLGRRIWGSIEAFILKIPLVGNIYTAFAKVFDTLFQHNQKAFREVVLIPYPYYGCYTLGFITGDAVGEINAYVGEKVVSVFVPTTPNPTSGFMLLLKEKDITVLQMPVEAAMKLIVSGGILQPERPIRNKGE
ncbi:MAG: DUF502 domain-containing protein [Epulopiscium sp.]|nr:DUF502 domain-containing protein [Candidatus Epulonipiscium sp.]